MISMAQTVVTPDRDAVISEVQIAAPPERVFQALSSSDLLIRCSHGDARPCHATLVRWELVPNQAGTLVKMTHSGLKPLPEGASYAEGWPGIMDWLKKFAETEEMR